MKKFSLSVWCGCLLLTSLFAPIRSGAEAPIRTFHETTNHSVATLRVQANQPSSFVIPRYITGKFSEHLHNNIYKGMDAQVLINPTLAPYPIWSGEMTPDGVTKFVIEDSAIDQQIKYGAAGSGWPESEIADLVTARKDALATFWTRVGPRDAVDTSPDTGPYVGRAQRVEVKAAGQGIAQWTYLPLHRIRKYEFEILLRSPNITNFTITLSPSGTNKTAAAHITSASPKWRRFKGFLELDASVPVEAACKLALTADAPGQFVVQRILLRPADHVNGADPDVVRLLKDSKLPLLRWPGGNFVSAYHWQDGVGPFEKRPTLPNYAWGSVEPNLFGTDEFIAFCRAVGCEPMICVNTGTGTPMEAANWIEYCNGPADSPMGALRAANGHPEPYNVKLWEVGNEMWGKWQVNWTTAAGYADRYLQFAQTMRMADPDIRLYACGAPVLWGKNWNDTLVSTVRSNMQTITDHPLIGGAVSRSADPLDVYRDFMGVPEVLENRWRNLEHDMQNAGISAPHLAVTELQLFAKLGDKPGSEPEKLNGSNLVGPGTQAEALYDVLLYHAAVRLSPFVELITHSATVNHGGGLRKHHEHVYANPCYYAQSAFAALAGSTILPVEVDCAAEKTPLVLPELRNAESKPTSYGALDAIASRTSDNVWLSLVNRGSCPLDVAVEVNGFSSSNSAEIRILSAEVPWASNSSLEPEKIKPVDSTATVQDGKLHVSLPPYTVARVSVAKK
ncbi:alpha-L-arabinofuranosidase C-terminal domain-containing protein [Pedosphaera parvula]|nr:alpha-L-arabinofuranosidase C-terminal domain-containing protein [Pedosphaera parvula]